MFSISVFATTGPSAGASVIWCWASATADPSFGGLGVECLSGSDGWGFSLLNATCCPGVWVFFCTDLRDGAAPIALRLVFLPSIKNDLEFYLILWYVFVYL